MPDTAPHRSTTRAGGATTSRLLLNSVAMIRRAVRAARSGEGTDAAPALVGDKVRCEAAMLLRSLWPLRGQSPELSSELNALAADLTVQDAARFAVQICLHPGIALDLANVPILLRDLGIHDPRLEPLLEEVLNHDRLHGPERQAHRELEQLWLEGIWKGTPRQAQVTRALACSALAWEFDHLSSGTDDAYAFTHAVLYASDLGRRLVTLPCPAAAVSADAEAILAVALDAGNHDVAAEALWTWPMLGLGWPALAEEAAAFLALVGSERGFLPGPGYVASVAASMRPGERGAYEVQTSYHTTLVHAMLIAASPGTRPTADTPTVGPETDLADIVQPVPRSGAWWEYLAGLPQTHRAALAPGLVTIGLRRAAATADLAGIATLLLRVADARLPDGPALRQARLLIARSLRCGDLASAETGERGTGRIGFPTRPAPRQVPTTA